jgi:hypothetical protein
VKGSEASGQSATVCNARFKRGIDSCMLHHTGRRDRLEPLLCEVLEAQSGRSLRSGGMNLIPYLDDVFSNPALKNPSKPPLQGRCRMQDR